MRNALYLIVICLLLQSCFRGKPRVLVFSKTKGYRHASINVGKPAIRKLGRENEFDVDTTELATYFTDDSLKKYSAVVFLSTTGDVLNPAQQNAFKRFIQAGGGFVGIHAAADTEYDWVWYGKLVGAWFKSHPKTQKARILKQPAAKPDQQVPEPWERTDEWYNYRNIAEDLHILFKLDETSYEGGENGGDHPLVWVHDFDGGRAFYTGMGHTDESYSDPDYLAQVLMGIRYAIGDNKVNYKKAKDKVIPEANRFSKEVFGYNLNEPTEMTVLPDGRIVFLERSGAVKLLAGPSDSIRLINRFNVNFTFEDGMIGLTHHPDFENNGLLYIFYSHPDRSANVLSQFHFTKEGVIDMSSEKEILEVVTQREQCCHTGGSLAFGSDGNLFISTGDNTNPFESDSYSPADERAGRGPFDAQKSSSNTNDLRGKVLRIRPSVDGTYTIPEGNLFAKGEPNTRPEIYVMGCRNPYRISVDSRTGHLYWGDVGPDAGNDSEVRGPRGYDEVNQAQGPGYFGWPLFIGNNYAYADYNFEKKVVGPRHDPKGPTNDSPNNTGKKELPAVSPPFIWYPYAQSPDFPGMMEGSRNAMAGPVYYSEDFKSASGTAFPDYLDGKLIIYDWMRGWVKLVSMDDNGKILDLEPFLENVKFNNLIDMQFGPDGRLYTLEYGTKWNNQNMDARLSVISFERGNRRPQSVLTSEVSTGAVPLVVNFSANKSIDPDGDSLSFELMVDGKTLTSTDGSFQVTFDKPGVFRPQLMTSDGKAPAQSSQLTIIAGNAPPVVDITWKGNSQFYLPGGSGTYKVNVSDQEDGSLKEGQVEPDRVHVTFDFLEQGFDITTIAQGHQRSELPGKILMAESDCKTCHMTDEKSAGPSYRDVAAKYEKDTKAVETLSDKILNGGAGVWGDAPMAAHPQISKEQALQMVEYILTLSKVDKKKSLPITGAVKFDSPQSPGEPRGAYILTASYEDKGSGALPSLSGEKSIVLRAPGLTGSDFDVMNGPRKRTAGTGREYLENVKHNSSATTRPTDLTGVGKLEFRIVEAIGTSKSGTIDVYLDSANSRKLGTANFKNSPKAEIREGIYSRTSTIRIGRNDGHHRLVLVFNNPEAGAGDLFTLRGINLAK